MNAPVDVLAVMDEAIVSMGMFKLGPDKLREARAAVAELIEAARNHLEAYGARYDVSERIGADADLRAALARIGGAV